jgi:ABC-type Zn2+ transport system substrate-binding protein/surface adhesin
MTDNELQDDKLEEQEQLAREIGEELTDAFVAYVRGDVAFEDLSFGVYDALSDLHVIQSGDYVLEDEEHDHDHDHEGHDHVGHDHAHDHEGHDHQH